MYNLLPVLASFAIFQLASSLSCPFPGPDLSQPKLLSGSSAFRSALENLTETLDSAAAGDINPGFLINQTSFSIIVTDAKQQLWSYHYTAPTTTNGTRHVGDHSQYRIASVTKMITNLLVLRLGLDLETKITHFLPELNKGNGGILWDRVTLRDLGSHMEGLQPLYGFPENYTLEPFYQQLGFPAVNASAYPLCEVAGLRPQLCTEETFVKGVSDTNPVFPLHSKPVYNNIGFSLLGYVIENVTGLSYEDAVKKYITGPVGMNGTSFLPLSEQDMVIPPVNGDIWASDFGGYNAAGGAFSTMADLSALQRAILSPNTSLLPQEKIRNWLQPLTFGTKIGEAVGFPWEISRTNNLSPRRTVDIYAKDGGVTGYLSKFALIPSYGIGFVVIAAGPAFGDPTFTILTEAVLAALFPAVEDATRAEAVDAGYTGRFSAGNDSWVEFTIDDGPGLVVEGWHSRGVDFLQSLDALYGAAYGVSFQGLKWRAYPSEVVNGENEDWRLVMDLPEVSTTLGGLGSRNVFAPQCTSWQMPGTIMYAGQAADKLVFKKKGGKVVAIEATALRTVFAKE